ncbi:hypothetical protein H8K35_13095 [Undibacterium sp. LX40W]|uniref:TraB/GumN family protein n=1 Tax=Undibacterium nitidum TaxID=2762298 RepID=A0A923HVW7_9BURK|nr:MULTISPECIES: DUF5694 domain-containing protein [Undibacterium]MBC3882324.1 hypothetical protein [Undibacterium nitidum]MBC3892605.1 hypothetical protein [Undibacterium sp. LX40W]
MKKTVLTLACVFGFIHCFAQAQTADFDPRAWKKNVYGKPTQVMVLGTPHISGYGEKLNRVHLSGLLDRLAQYEPNIIAIEALSGEQCDFLRLNTLTHPDVHKDYCWDPAPAQKAIGLGLQEALVEIQSTLQQWAQHANRKPSAEQRRRLVAVFLAANDRASALVQWLRLDVSERKAIDGIEPSMLKFLNRETPNLNENYEVAAVLAARLGLERVYATDDHTSDEITDRAGPKFGEALQDMWSKIDIPEKKESLALEAKMNSAQDVLNLYRFYNNPRKLRSFIAADFGGGLKHATPELYGRQYVAWWETRNLRMVANIRTAFGNHPGAKVLVVVGSSHKPYFDAYLNMMHEVQLVDSFKLLK